MDKGTVIVGLRNAVDQIWGDDEAPKPKRAPYKLRVALAGPRVTPRHPEFDYLLDLGSAMLEGLMRHQPLAKLGISDGATLRFYFPERWLSVHEQHMFLHRLSTHPEAARLAQIDVVTQNPLIIGGIDKECLRVFHFPADESDPTRPGVGLLDREMH